eukprot:6879585-Pyramimonas_sp.AAC.1
MSNLRPSNRKGREMYRCSSDALGGFGLSGTRLVPPDPPAARPEGGREGASAPPAGSSARTSSRRQSRKGRRSQSRNGRRYLQGAGANRARGGGIHREQKPIVRGEGVSTGIRSQSRKGRGYPTTQSPPAGPGYHT